MSNCLFDPLDDYGHKWWRFEVQFARRLSIRQQRKLILRLHEVTGDNWPPGRQPWQSSIGVDGICHEQWPVKWPSMRHGQLVLRALGVTFETHFGEPRFTLRTGVEPWRDEDEERTDGPPLTCTCDQWAVKRLELRWPERRPWGRHG